MLTVDGLELQNVNYSFHPTDTLRGMASKRLGSAEIPGRNGLIPSLAMNAFSANEVIIKLWVAIEPCGDYDHLYGQHLDMLFHLFGPLQRLLDVRRTMPDGSVRQAHGRVLEAVRPAGDLSHAGDLVVAMQLPEVFWRDVDAQVFSGPASAASPHNLRVETLTGATAPIEDAIYLVHGPAASGVGLACPDTGGWIRLNRALAVGEVWRVDADLWASEVGSVGMGFNGQATDNVIAQTEFAGSGARLLAMQPTMAAPLSFTASDPNFVQLMEENRVCNLILTGTGFGAGTKVEVKARRKFL